MPLLVLLLILVMSAGFASAAEPIARVRIAFDRNGETSVQAEGFADMAAKRTLTADDPVRIASISKLAVAIGVLRLVEQGKLRLDDDVSRQLGRSLRNPAFPDAPITLRMLLSHTSSLTDAAGYWNAPLGSRVQRITDDGKAWDTTHPPGTFFRYTNLNFPLVAQLMERATGERFDRLMRRLVLEPLQLDACFNWSGCSNAGISRGVVLYGADGKPQKDDLHGIAPNCPVLASADGNCDLSRWQAGQNGALFSPQGGLRISARDLGRIGRMLLNDGLLDGVRVLQPATVQWLAKPAWTSIGGNGVMSEPDEPNSGKVFCSYGLAVHHLARGNGISCRDDLFGDGRSRMGHSGNAYGLLSGLWIDREAGTGVAYFATGVFNDSSGAHSAFNKTEEQCAKGW